MDKSYRIHTNISNDTFVNVDMSQDFNFLEVLTLSLSQSDAYKLHSSNYGVVIGRVLANDAFGIPNAKVSVFVEKDTNDTGSELEALYPYIDTTTKDGDGRRYNLLPDYSDDECYRVVGTFPNKRLVLDDNVMIEVYDKYYRYTTVTNASGDYMIFGVPSGSQKIHVDLDLSDIGILSQKPRDFEYKGYNVTMFDNPNQFKSSTNLEGLAQIFSQDRGVFVYPFWGDENNGIAAITRCDISIQYKFEPTCVFMGSIVSDNDSNSIGHRCAPSVNNGRNDQLVAGEGTIEMIRKTVDGLVEEFQIQGNQLINSDGVWCYQIPMNLDFIGMDEYGNIVPTDNPNKGIPTRAQVRFRISKNESGDEGFSRHTAKYLVPMNPMFKKDSVVPTIDVDGKEIEKMYEFGSATPQSCFRDLYWNNVYSVKNYIPKVQVAHRAYSSNYSALKGSNLATNQNQIPFNKLKIDIPFNYMIICILFTIVMKIIGIINAIVRAICSIVRVKIGFVRPFAWIGCPTCIPLNAGIEDTNVAYYPGCGCPKSEACKKTSCPDEMGRSCVKKSDDIELEDKIQQNLSLEYNVVKLDFYQDWINGALYMPLWYWRKRKKKTFLFGLFSSRAKNEFCDCDKTYKRLKTALTCMIEYSNNSLKPKGIKEKEEKWHKDKSNIVKFRNGIIKDVPNKEGLDVYYYAAVQATDNNTNPDMPMSERKKGFYAIRLYATDIILLGNLNEDNLYGIPQFYKVLPSTTANVPPIATIEESLTDLIDGEKSGKYDITNDKEDSGTSITTGMDWGARGGRDKPIYQKGLFMDLACTYAVTKAKSCINVERLSELGVNLDMSYDKSYSNGANNVQTGRIEADGFVTKLELDDEVNRAMFATMNHVGFVPQTYQDNNGTWYDTQVEDEATHYLIPKFKYIYPVDFDGRLQDIMQTYKNGFSQAMLDERDESYLTFRFGAEKSGDKMGKRHFYKEGPLAMPLYNNSFYFYFGINKGKTAIEKFNELFDAKCYSNVAYPFTLDTSSRGKAFCPELYTDESNSYAYIRVTVDDIQAPFSYVLKDENGNVVISEDNMNIKDFVIGGKLVKTETDDVVEAEDAVRYHDSGAYEYGSPVEGTYRNGLTNQTYMLEVVDEYFKKIKKAITLSPVPLEIYYSSNALGTKFYDETTTPIINIRQDETYGRIIVSGVSIDGYQFDIISADITNLDTGVCRRDIVSSSITATLKVLVAPSDSGMTSMFNPDLYVYLTYSILDEGLKFGDVTDVYSSQGSHCSSAFTSGETSDGKRVIVFEVDRPTRWALTMEQVCNGKPVKDNAITETTVVENGLPLMGFLNDMPTLFMAGDLSARNLGEEGRFYSISAVSSATDSTMEGWYGVHQEDTFLFNEPKYMPVNRNQEMWSEYVNVIYDMDTPATKHSVLKFKFDALFSLSEGVYVTNEGNTTLTYRAKGGVPPILYHSLIPYYGSENAQTSTYLFSNGNSATVDKNFPNIVGSNYKYGGVDANGLPQLNPAYGTGSGLFEGNYFAAFTNDGTEGKTRGIPWHTYNKPKGEDSLIGIGNDEAKEVYTGTNYNSYLRGMFVDRRIDYDLVIFPPFQGNTGALSDEEDGVVPTWRYSRVMGKIYNGIEMSYDEMRNIISADDYRYMCCEDGDEGCSGYSACTEDMVEYNGEVISAAPNTRLEYSYSYNFESNGIVKTIYNIPTRTYWEDEPGNEGKQLVKRYYTVNFNGVDVKNYLWSSFNKESLRWYTSQPENTSAYTSGGSMIYVVPGHEGDDNNLYNGDFNRRSALAGNYPTERYIDIINKNGSNYLSLYLVGCSYNTPIEEDDGLIRAEAGEGEDVDISFDYQSIIKFKPKNEDDNEYVNLNMASNPIGGGHETVFKRVVASLIFSYEPRIEDGFKIYTSRPSLIRVLPVKQGTDMDGITYIKMSKDENDLTVRKGDVTVCDFSDRDVDGRDIFIRGIVLPAGIRLNRDGFFDQPTDHENYEAITFYKIKTNAGVMKPVNVENVEVMSIEYENKYVCDDGSHLKKALHTVEFSAMYDLRDILVGIVTGDSGCYYIDADGNIQHSGGVQDAGWTHHLQFYIDVSSDRTKNTMLQYPELLTFSFRFRRKGGPYYLRASDFRFEYEDQVGDEEPKVSKIYISVDWTPDMNLGNDDNWRRNALFIQNQEGFTYGLEFKLKFFGLNNPTPIFIS